MRESKEAHESESLEHGGEEDISVEAHHKRLDTIEKALGIGKHAPKKKTDMERMKERKRHG